MLDLKLEVVAYDCFGRTMMQSGRLKADTGLYIYIYFIIYDVNAFFPKVIATLFVF